MKDTAVLSTAAVTADGAAGGGLLVVVCWWWSAALLSSRCFLLLSKGTCFFSTAHNTNPRNPYRTPSSISNGH
jgi:hypothetical protein